MLETHSPETLRRALTSRRSRRDSTDDRRELRARLVFHQPGKPPTAQVAIFTAILATEGERLVVYDLFTSALLAVISNLSLARYWLGLRSVI